MIRIRGRQRGLAKLRVGPTHRIFIVRAQLHAACVYIARARRVRAGRNHRSCARVFRKRIALGRQRWLFVRLRLILGLRLRGRLRLRHQQRHTHCRQNQRQPRSARHTLSCTHRFRLLLLACLLLFSHFHAPHSTLHGPICPGLAQPSLALSATTMGLRRTLC